MFPVNPIIHQATITKQLSTLKVFTQRKTNMGQKLISISLLVLYLTIINPYLIQGAAVPPRIVEGLQGSSPHFKYIGHLTSQKSVRGHIQSQTSFYFLSQNAASYVAAGNDCKAFLTEDTTLLYIETQEELANVTQFIRDSDDTGSSYWVGGRYDTSRATFVWDNDVEIGPWAPWDQGHPNTRTPVTRVYAHTVGDVKLRTQFNTVSTRYICEMKVGEPGEEAEPCYDDNDLVIVVDSSGSIGEEQYLVALEFTSRLATAWADNPNNRLSMIVFSTDARSVFGLSANLTVNDIKDLVYNSGYDAGWTKSDLGLDRAALEFSQNPRSVPKNLVFLTDGDSNDKPATLAAAQRVKDAGIRSFAVGIGPAIGADELLAMAGNNANHVFNTEGFDDLLKLLQPVSRRVCEN